MLVGAGLTRNRFHISAISSMLDMMGTVCGHGIGVCHDIGRNYAKGKYNAYYFSYFFIHIQIMALPSGRIKIV